MKIISLLTLIISAIVLISCEETPEPQTNDGTRGIYFIVDVSGSMDRPTRDQNGDEDYNNLRYKVATKALNLVLESIYNRGFKDLNLGVRKFSDWSTSLYEIAPYTSLLQFTEDDLRPTDGTAIGDALNDAHKDIQTKGSHIQNWTIILITDGENGLGEEPLDVLRKLNDLNESSDQKLTVQLVTLDFKTESDYSSVDIVKNVVSAQGKELERVLETIASEALGDGNEGRFNACAVNPSQAPLGEDDLKYDRDIDGPKLASRYEHSATITLRERNKSTDDDIAKTIYEACSDKSGSSLSECLETECRKIVYENYK